MLIASAGIAKTANWRNRLYAVLAKFGKAITLVPPLRFWRRQFRARLYHRTGSDYLAAGPLQGTFIKIVREDLAESARHVLQPTLLIWGDADDQTPLADGQKLSHLIPHATLQVVPGAGHFVHHDAADTVGQLVREFLAS